jgi:hypothetical protein
MGTSGFWRHHAMMPQERRLSTRKMPEHLAYLSLPFDNGGIVVDISEGGLGFRAIAPVKADGPIHFRFAIDSATRIRAVGELAWKDETGKIGGLRFTQLPDEVREKIRVWAGQSKTSGRDIPVSLPAIEASAPAVPFSAASLSPVGAVLVAEPPIESEAAPFSEVVWAPVVDTPIIEPPIEADVTLIRSADFAPLAENRNPLLYNLKPPIYSAPLYELSMFPMESKFEARAAAVAARPSVVTSHPIASIALTFVLALLVSIGIFAYVSTRWVGESLFAWGEQMWGGTHSQQIPQEAAPQPTSAPDTAKIPRQ